MNALDPRARLLDLAAARGVSLAALSGLIGRNSTYLQQFVRKGSPRKLEEGDRRKLAEFLGVGEAELGGPEYFSHDRGAGRSISVAGAAPLRREWLDIPRLDISARWLREQGFDAAMLSAIRVSGDSMEPLLRDGDEILVDCTPRPLRDGIHVVRVDGTLLVKRVQTGIPGRVMLESENTAYRPVALAPAEVEVIGRVVWKGGRL